MDSFLFELRYALRTLIKNRGFTFVVVFTLALGIGTNTSIFSIVDSILIRALPYQEPDALVALYESIPQEGVSQLHASGPNFVDWKNQAKSFRSMASYSDAFFNVSGNDFPERVAGVHVSEEFFATLGVQPLFGRVFVPAEIQSNSQTLAVLSYSLWQRRFAGSDRILKSPVRIDGKMTTIIGIMPAGFQFPSEAEVWMPQPTAPLSLNRNLNMLSVIARLKQAGRISEAQSEMKTIATRLQREYPDSNKDHEFRSFH
jgi:putative ABC transport system permease protein